MPSTVNASIIPTNNSANASIIPTNNSALEFTEGELEEVKKWTSRYTDLDGNGRFDLLKSQILPRLFLLNKHLSADAWKDRKRVSPH